MAFVLAHRLSTSLVVTTLLTVCFVPTIGGEPWSDESPGAPAPSSGSSEEDDAVLQSQEEDTLQNLVRLNTILHGDSRAYDLMAPPPSKRSTMLLNKLMQPLLKAFKSDAEVSYTPPMELRRRGEGKMFWRCYFNAVSCFRRRK
ncbi:uncharacterized protein LOC142804147 [Rhipicephalus microplus]|uniref:uncharacterized protein LOC142804147 n=1 Tax=Rhipicephalus microplus TaxID=6941 RepID=UPI003F6B5112|nr:allatostatin-CC [Rhipicephalus microplus]